MKTIRYCLAATVLLAVALSLSSASAKDPVDYARPMVGTDGTGHTFPGAIVPFGMVQLSPDTGSHDWEHSSGYYYRDQSLAGFSHTHMSGVGCQDGGDFLFLPFVGQLPAGDPPRAAFSHDHEHATPGYYQVELTDPKINVELTATAHAGFHRYTFPAAGPAHVLIDLASSVGIPKDHLKAAGFNVEDDHTASGFRRYYDWGPERTIFFVAEFSRPITGQSSTCDSSGAVGRTIRAHLDFMVAAGEPVLVKVGLSTVSIEGARANLHAEIPAWDFDGAHAAARKAWNDQLARIDLGPGDEAAAETFYTALYHSYIHPNLFSDVDGSYRGPDQQIYHTPGHPYYTTFSTWDTYRALHPLLTLTAPERVNDMVGSLLAFYQHSPDKELPIWLNAGVETRCMNGHHSIPIITEAYVKGFRGFDAVAALEAMKTTQASNHGEGQQEYREHGYMSTGKERRAVSRTMEYAYDDWCVSQFANALGKPGEAAPFAERSRAYRNLYDPQTKFMRGKTADGQWHEPFDPLHADTDDYTEADAWHYTWAVQQDPKDLIRMMGGDAPYIKHLDEIWTQSSKITGHVLDITGLIGQYAHGNEPVHHMAYLYNFAGAPWKTQQHVRDVMAKLYDNTPEGLCGNDDCGQMSAWYVLSALGFYPVDPTTGVYVLGSPLVNSATLHLQPGFAKGGAFRIIAKNNSPTNVYVQSVTLNGQPLTRSWIKHDEITAGGELVFVMGPEPNKTWGAAEADRP